MGSDSEKCVLCKMRKEDILNLGELKKINRIRAHYYCLLLSSTITQSGNDTDGILGFLSSDIIAEVNRARKRVCIYCKTSGATVICSAKCKASFHLPCGLAHGSGHQFHGSFSSTCGQHRPRQKYTIPAEPQECPICYEIIDFDDWMQVLRAPCCKKAFFHRPCVQQLALSAGYFFKCPMCNNKPTFLRSMRHYGVFVPDRDASWEMVPDAYGELLERHEECNAEECVCPHGRKVSREHSIWSLVLCNTCGSQGIHLRCGNLKRGDKWSCQVCLSVEQHPKSASSDSEGSSSTRHVTTSVGRSVITVQSTFDPQPSTSRGVISITNINIDNTTRLKIKLVTKPIRKRKRGSPSLSSQVNTRSRARSCESTPERDSSKTTIESIDVGSRRGDSDAETAAEKLLLNSENAEQSVVKQTLAGKRARVWLDTTNNQTNEADDENCPRGRKVWEKPRPDSSFTMNLRGHTPSKSHVSEQSPLEPNVIQNTMDEKIPFENNSYQPETNEEITPEVDIHLVSESEMSEKEILESDDDVIFVNHYRYESLLGNDSDASDDEIIVLD